MGTGAAGKRPGMIRRMALKALGIPLELTDPLNWPTQNAVDSSSGATVTPDSAMKLSAVWACTRLLSQTIASLPISVFETTPDGKRMAPLHPLHSVIHSAPNPDATATVFWESVVAATLLRGVARCEKLFVGNRLVGLRFLAPNRLTIRYRNGTYLYHYVDSNLQQREIPRDRIWTLPGFSLDGEHGVSVIRYGAEVFGSAIAANGAANSQFKRGLHSTVAVTYPRILNPEQRKEARDTMRTLSGYANAGEPIVLERDSTVHNIGISPEDAQLLESRAWSVEEICRWFGVDPSMVGHGAKVSNWGTGLEQKVIAFLMFTLRPLLQRIEQQISKDLLTPADRTRFYVKVVIEGLLRADTAARAQFYAAMVNNGILTRDEVRELEDRPPMGGNAAVLTVQTAMAPLDSIGQTSIDEQVRASMRAWLIGPEPTETPSDTAAAAPSSAGE